jgi:hypothetical protein
MIMDDILCLFVLCGLIYGFYRWYIFTHKPKDQLNFIRAEQELQVLNEKKEELRALEYLITDVDACSNNDGLYKYFTLSWMNEMTGENLEYQFFVWDNKSPIAVAMKSLADVERERLRPEFQKSLDEVGKKSRKPTNKVPEIVIRDHRDVR